MCEPLSLLTAAGAGLSAFGSIRGGQQAADGSDVTAEFLRNNAGIQSGNADLALGNVDMLKRQAAVMRDSADLARARARIPLARTQQQGDIAGSDAVNEFASRHIDPTTGSPLLLQLLNASRVKNDMDLIASSGEVDRADALTRAAGVGTQAAGEAGRAAGAYSQAGSTYANAMATRMRGNQALQAGMFGAATSLLSGFGKAKGLPGFSSVPTYGYGSGGSAAP